MDQEQSAGRGLELFWLGGGTGESVLVWEAGDAWFEFPTGTKEGKAVFPVSFSRWAEKGRWRVRLGSSQ